MAASVSMKSRTTCWTLCAERPGALPFAHPSHCLREGHGHPKRRTTACMPAIVAHRSAAARRAAVNAVQATSERGSQAISTTR